MPIVPCTNTPVVQGIVTFDPTIFKAAYPEFSTIADAILTANFGLAEMQLSNSCCSRIQNATLREKLLNLLVAHVTQLRNGVNGQAASGAVGRVSYAMEGSVMATVDMGSIVLGQAYYMQTQWGALYWSSTASYRTFRYIPAPATCFDDVGDVFPSSDCGC
jgi:hypothetical protein